jgi:tRNA(Ile)-lysidine synthetase-like protein
LEKFEKLFYIFLSNIYNSGMENANSAINSTQFVYPMFQILFGMFGLALLVKKIMMMSSSKAHKNLEIEERNIRFNSVLEFPQYDLDNSKLFDNISEKDIGSTTIYKTVYAFLERYVVRKSKPEPEETKEQETSNMIDELVSDSDTDEETTGAENEDVKSDDVDDSKSDASDTDIKDYTNVIQSLSGGVDSMASMVCMLSAMEEDNCPFDNLIACHINYGNREEADDEQEFIEHWCEQWCVPLHVLTIPDDLRRGVTDRGEYETRITQLRFDFYKELMEMYDTSYIFLGHQQDDLVENVLTNVVKSRTIFDLNVMHDTGMKFGVKLFRPLLSVSKEAIFDFANEQMIPYFLNTTPEWSTRGKLRDGLIPHMEDVFKDSFRTGFLNLGNESDEWNGVIREEVINPLLDTATRYEHGFSIPLNTLPKRCVLKLVLMDLLHEKAVGMIRNTSFDHLYSRLSNEQGTDFSENLSSGVTAMMYQDTLYVVTTKLENTKWSYEFGERIIVKPKDTTTSISMTDFMNGTIKYAVLTDLDLPQEDVTSSTTSNNNTKNVRRVLKESGTVENYKSVLAEKVRKLFDFRLLKFTGIKELRDADIPKYYYVVTATLTESVAEEEASETVTEDATETVTEDATEQKQPSEETEVSQDTEEKD